MEELLKRGIAALIAVSMLAGLLVVVSDDAAALPSDAWITGKVTDGVDPVPNSYVKVMMFVADGLDINYTFTDVNGDYLVGVPGGFDYMMFVANGSYYMSMQPVTVMTGETVEVDFTLEEITEPTDVTIMGFVEDEFGTAITEGHVLGIVNDPMGGDTPHYANMTTPAGDGYFEIDVIAGPAGGGAVLMDYPGYSMIENDTEDPLVGGETYWFNITVEAEISVDDAMFYGQVTDFGTGLPLQNVMVSVEIWNSYLIDDYTNHTFTDSDGNYELNVTNGSARLVFTKGGYSMKMYENLEVLPSDALQYDEALVATTCFVKGNVTDLKSGDPLVFANVFMMDGEGNFSSTITNDTGFFELRCVDGDDLLVAAQMEGYSTNWIEVSLAPDEVYWHDFGLWPVSSWLEGYVTDGISGDPVGNAWVRANSMEYNDGDNTDAFGYYNISLVQGDYTVSVEAPNYRNNESDVNIPDETTVVHDVALLPWDLPETCRLYGWVNDTGSGTGIDRAEMKVQLADQSYYNRTETDSDGYYEIFVPPVALMYGATADMHYPDFGALDASIGPEIRMDILLDPDAYGPNVTYTQSPVENVTWFNPTVIDAEIEEPNLREMTLMQFMFWKVEGTWEYYYVIDMDSTSFDPFNPSEGIPYTITDDNYTIHEEWNATVQAGGWLSDGVDSLYLMAYEQWWGPEPSYALRGLYTNSTDTDVGCTAIFDSDTGEVEMLWLDTSGEADLDADPTATFDPVVMAYAFDVDDWMERDMTYWGAGAGHQLNLVDLSLQLDRKVPSGDYKTWFLGSDFGRQGIPVDFVNFTVDNDPPVADAGEDWSSVVNTTATLNGSDSSDNVGIVSYVWDFVDDGTPVQYTEAIAEHEFTEAGVYELNLTVTDGAGHENVSSVTLTVTEDAPPVADPGLDVIVDEDTVVVFDGSASTDDVGIENYTWTIVELSVELYGVSPEFTFDTPDVYTVELIVNDTIGQLSSPGSMTVTVEDVTDPTAIAGLDMSVPSDSPVTLNGSLSSDNVGVVIFNWTFTDDGSQVSLIGEAVDYVFSNVGVIVVTLTVEDAAGNNDTDELTVTVLDATDPVADAGPDQIVEAGEEVTFDGVDSSDNVLVVSWTWTFEDDGDDVTRTGVSPTYTFDNSGVFVVTLTVEDAAGNSDDDTVTIRVNSPPVADAGADTTITVGATVTFDGESSSDDSGVENYTWTFAYDGAVETLYGVAPSFTFEIAGNYTVTLVVEDASGLTDTDSVVVNVEEDDGVAEDKSFLEEYWWLLVAIGAIVAVMAVVAALMMSKKGAGGMPGSSPEEPEDLPPPPDAPDDGEL